MRWAGHVAGMGDRRGAYRVLMRKPNHLEDTDETGGITLKFILKNGLGGRERDLSGLGYEKMAGSF
jgi:hypothetical protein